MGFFDVFSDAFSGIKDAAGSVFGGVKDTFGSVFNGVKSIGEGAYNSVLKPVFNSGMGLLNRGIDRVDRLGNLADKTIDAAGNGVEGIGNMLNSPILLYIGLGAAGLILLPKLADKFL